MDPSWDMIFFIRDLRGRRSWKGLRCGRRRGHDHRLRPGLLWEAPRCSVLGGRKSMENRENQGKPGETVENCRKSKGKCRKSMETRSN